MSMVVIDTLPGFAELPATAQQAVKGCIAKKGKYKGFITRSTPKSQAAQAARQALFMRVNPFKVSVGATVFFTLEQAEVFNEVLAWIDRVPLDEAIKLDRDRSQLEALGVW